MSQKIKSVFLASLPAIVIATFLAAVVIYAWTEPSSPPPSGNVSAPLNVSTTTQYKGGALGIGGLFQTDKDAYLASFSGNVGIGTTNPTTGKLVVSGGNVDVTNNKIINVKDPTLNTDAATRGWVTDYVDALGGGGGSSWAPAGTYFLEGGVGNPAGANVYYCSKKIIDATGYVTDTAINPNQPCDVGDSSKKCYNGTCVTVVWLTYAGTTHTENQCSSAGGTVYNTGGSGTLCRFSAASCPVGWVQAGNWQKYSVASWGSTDACGYWMSYGPTTFSNSIAHNYSQGGYQDCCGASCWGGSWNGPGPYRTWYYLNDIVNPSTNRLEVGCK